MVKTTKHLKHPKVQGQLSIKYFPICLKDGVRTACCGGLGCDQGGGNFLEKTSDGRLGRKVGSLFGHLSDITHIPTSYGFDFKGTETMCFGVFPKWEVESLS